MSTIIPEDVFTPRASAVNTAMYVERPNLETALKNALRGTQHPVLYGDSGSGKTWLYKKVLEETGTYLVTANLANACRLGSISKEITSVLHNMRGDSATNTGYSETKEAKGKIPILEGSLSNTRNYEIPEKDSLLECFQVARKYAKSKPACMVLDNLESIFHSEELMRELANIVTIMDDDRYGVFAVKLLIVGVPSGISEYFARTPNRQTVANRLQELPEVSRMSKDQVGEFISRGFRRELQYEISNRTLSDLIKKAAWVTDRTPQRLHEFCLELARIAHSSGEVKPDMFKRARWNWLRSSLNHSYTAIEARMNDRTTSLGRRNQVLYTLGCLIGEDFRANDVEAELRHEFPLSTKNRAIKVSSILTDLTKGTTPILRRVDHGNSFVFTDPRFRICIRAMLYKDEDTQCVIKAQMRLHD